MTHIHLIRFLPVALLVVAAGCSSNSSDGTTDAGTVNNADGGNNADPCALPNTCTAAVPACVGLVDNAGKSTFSLRVADVATSKPAVLSHGIVSSVVSTGVTPNIESCRLQGGMTANWLLQFDSSGKQLKVGGAKPVADSTSGYSFVDENLGGLQIAPATTSYSVPGTNEFQSEPVDVVLPVYLDASATSVLLFPIKKLKATGTLSNNNSCIGHYNSKELDPDNACAPDDSHPAYLAGGKLEGFITLEDADATVISALNQSLCVILSGDAAQFGERNAMGQTVCKRTGGVINFQGDWCAATNAAAGGGCSDAVQFSADIAAQSIKVN